MSNICGEAVSKSRVKFRTFYLDFRYFGTVFRHSKNIQWLKITFKTKSKKIHVEFDAKNGILGLNRAKIVKITDFSKILNNQAREVFTSPCRFDRVRPGLAVVGLVKPGQVGSSRVKPWTALGGPGRPWTVLDGPGRPWTALDGPGRPWTALDGPGRPWTVLDVF